MHRTGLKVLAALVALCMVAPGAIADQAPRRIVSMNQCTDLLLLHLVEPGRIASISFVTGQRAWTPPDLADEVRGLPRNRGLAEEVIPLSPDLVVTGAFSSTAAADMLRRLGYRVEVFAPEASLADVRANIRRMGELVGEGDRAEAMVAAIDSKLAQAGAGGQGAMPVLADVGVNSWMSGQGSLMGELANAAGLQTLGQAMGNTGYRFMSLEQIIAAKPDVLAFINAWSGTEALGSGVFRHPAYRRLVKDGAAEADLPERLIACASPDLGEAAIRLSAARREARPQ
jgi:iron complex transport system substrate-binding protein